MNLGALPCLDKETFGRRFRRGRETRAERETQRGGVGRYAPSGGGDAPRRGLLFPQGIRQFRPANVNVTDGLGKPVGEGLATLPELLIELLALSR